MYEILFVSQLPTNMEKVQNFEVISNK